MPDKKLTDNEIVKALECCTKGLECKNCPANPHKGNYGFCTGLLLKDALDLIIRQQAENDLLKEINKRYKSDFTRMFVNADIKNVPIKEDKKDGL